jgi:hypothetical protein
MQVRERKNEKEKIKRYLKMTYGIEAEDTENFINYYGRNKQ